MVQSKTAAYADSKPRDSKSEIRTQSSLPAAEKVQSACNARTAPLLTIWSAAGDTTPGHFTKNHREAHCHILSNGLTRGFWYRGRIAFKRQNSVLTECEQTIHPASNTKLFTTRARWR